MSHPEQVLLLTLHNLGPLSLCTAIRIPSTPVGLMLQRSVATSAGFSLAVGFACLANIAAHPPAIREVESEPMT